MSQPPHALSRCEEAERAEAVVTRSRTESTSASMAAAGSQCFGYLSYCGSPARQTNRQADRQTDRQGSIEAWLAEENDARHRVRMNNRVFTLGIPTFIKHEDKIKHQSKYLSLIQNPAKTNPFN